MKSFDDGRQAVGIVRGGDEAYHVLGLGEQAGYLVDDGVDTDEAGGGRGRRCRIGLISPIMRNLVVLAVDALEVAVGEKDVADALGAAEGWLLATVDANSGDFGLAVGMAKAKCFNTVGGTLAWTEGAFHVAKIRFFDEKNLCFKKKVYFCSVKYPCP